DNKPSTEQPNTKPTVDNKPSTEQPSTKPSTDNKPSTEQPSTKPSTDNKPSTEQPSTKPSIDNKPSTKSTAEKSRKDSSKSIGKSNSNQNDSEKLPSTGEETAHTIGGGLLAMLFSSIIGFMGLGSKKKNKK